MIIYYSNYNIYKIINLYEISLIQNDTIEILSLMVKCEKISGQITRTIYGFWWFYCAIIHYSGM